MFVFQLATILIIAVINPLLFIAVFRYKPFQRSLQYLGVSQINP